MTTNLTAREAQILVAVVKFATIDSKSIDWAKVSKEAQFNTAKQARDKFAAVRNKLMALPPGSVGVGIGTGTVTNGTGKGGVKRKRVSRDSGDAEEDNDSGSEPKKKGKTKAGGRTGKKGKKAASPSPEPISPDDGDDSEEDLKALIKTESDDGEEDGDLDGADFSEEV